jgi:hypothetical protein
MADEIVREDIRIEGSTATWEINTVGNINGTYIGTFKFKTFLTPLQKIAAGREERELLGANLALAGESERFLAFALCQLKFRIISAPPFWSTADSSGFISGNISDEEVISVILNAAFDAEAIYKQDIVKRKLNAIDKARKAHEAILKKQKEQDEADEKANQED